MVVSELMEKHRIFGTSALVCSNIDMSVPYQIFPGYFIRGLESLNPVSHNQEDIKRLKDKLENMDKNCAVCDHV